MNHKIYTKLTRIAFDMIDVPNAVQKHFSFLLRKNRIAAIGWNNAWKTHPLSKRFGTRFAGIHSELAVIKNARYDIETISRLTLVNIRVNSHGLVLNSRPCISCQKLLTQFDIRNIYWSISDKEFGYEEINIF